MPFANDNAKKEDGDRGFGDGDAQNADSLANGFPHDGFRITRWFYGGIFLADTVGDAYGCANDVAEEE